jgi:hypothetical protein
MRYLIIIEETTTGYSAYSPDLPGCVSTGETREELEGYKIPQPSTSSVYIEVAA